MIPNPTTFDHDNLEKNTTYENNFQFRNNSQSEWNRQTPIIIEKETQSSMLRLNWMKVSSNLLNFPHTTTTWLSPLVGLVECSRTERDKKLKDIRTRTCRFQASMFLRCGLLKWSDTFLWLAALNTFLIWLTAGDDGRRVEMIERVLFIKYCHRNLHS